MIKSCRSLEGQRLMWSIVIELVAKDVEGALLGPVVSRGWAGGLSFESAMHSFMSTVLLRFAGFDQFGENPEANKPGGES